MISVQQLSNMDIPKIDKKTKQILFLTYFLQQNADLTFRESRAVLREISGETAADLAEEFDCSLQAIYNYNRTGIKKMGSLSFEIE